MLSAKEAIACGELVVYIPFFAVALYVGHRHGLARQLGFFYLVLFCGIRAAGAVFELLSKHYPDNATDAEWAGILNSIGLSPLLLASAGLLKRLNDLLKPNSYRVRLLQLLAIPSYIALALAVAGGTSLDSPTESKRHHALIYIKFSGVIFTLVFLALIGLAILTLPDYRSLPPGETQIYLAVIAALPLLALRMLYTLLSDFENNKIFSPFGGSVWARLAMATVGEVLIVGMYLGVGILARPMSEVVREVEVQGGGQGFVMATRGGQKFEPQWPRPQRV